MPVIGAVTTGPPSPQNFGAATLFSDAKEYIIAAINKDPTPSVEAWSRVEPRHAVYRA